MKNLFYKLIRLILFVLISNISFAQTPTILWDKTLGGGGTDEPLTIIQTSDGGYLLAGYSSSYISGDKSENSRGGHDFWIVKTDAGGNKLWDKTLGGSGTDVL